MIFLLLTALLAKSAATELPVAGEIRSALLALHPRQQQLIDHLKLTAQSVDAELRRIDPYARLLPKQTSDAEPEAGIGADLYQDHGRWWLLPYAQGPLDAAGLHGAARLLAVGEQQVQNQTGPALASLLRGPPGSVVCLLLQQQQKPFDLCMARAPLQAVSVEILGAGRLRIRAFHAHETRIRLQQILELWDLSPDQELVIDLRGSPGGDLYDALDSAALFLAPKLPLVTLYETGRRPEVVTVPSSLPTWEMPLRLLVDRNTASAAEIFAGILHYYQRAQLQGETTYGKCLSQTLYPLSDGSRLRLTNMRVVFPDGSSCQGRGLPVDNENIHPDKPINKEKKT